jgi:carbon monoxide dehydrogenase subunit G
MLTVTGKHGLPATPETIWPRIFDPDTLAILIPGCQHLEQVGPDEYRGSLRIGIAAVGGTYQTHVRITEQRAPEYCAFTGTVDGPTGTVRGDVHFTLRPLPDGGTELAYQGQAIISGALGSLAGRLVESVAQTLLKQGLAQFEAQLRGDQPAAEPRP